jgi:hypothetical protein
MSRMLRTAILALGGLIALGTAPAWARTVAIESSAPLTDRSPDAIRSAARVAIERGVEEARTMGLPHVALHDATVEGDRLTVQLIATDEEGEPGTPATPDTDEPAPGTIDGDVAQR